MVNIMKRIFPGIVKKEYLDKYQDIFFCDKLYQYTSIKCQIDGIMACADLFCPDFVMVKDYVFLDFMWNPSNEQDDVLLADLEKRFYGNKKNIEMFVNSCSLGDFLGFDERKIADDENVIREFGKSLQYFWQNRLKEVFPEKNMVVEIGMDLMGEYGYTITVYRKE